MLSLVTPADGHWKHRTDEIILMHSSIFKGFIYALNCIVTFCEIIGMFLFKMQKQISFCTLGLGWAGLGLFACLFQFKQKVIVIV